MFEDADNAGNDSTTTQSKAKMFSDSNVENIVPNSQQYNCSGPETLKTSKQTCKFFSIILCYFIIISLHMH